MIGGFLVTARRFRPQRFKDLIGQPHISRTIANQIKNNSVGQAYIFAGTRGVGKTSTARILAKALNCENRDGIEPCLECETCKHISDGSYIDLIEIDGASNRGIENIKEIRDNIRFAPISSRYKIYIIDEVHQITRDGFNALLKTLEEPPSYAVFIFATTEISKLPETILSRCQSFEFKPIHPADIEEKLKVVSKYLSVKIDDESVRIIAERARGSMRDAESMFDQIVAYSGKEVRSSDLKELLGMVDSSVLVETLKYAADSNFPAIFRLADKVADDGADLYIFIDDLLKLIKDLINIKIGSKKLHKVKTSDLAELESIGSKVDFDDITLWFDILEGTKVSILRSFTPRISFEIGISKLANSKGMLNVDNLMDEIVLKSKNVRTGDRSFDTDNRDRSFDADNRDRSFDTDNRDRSLNTDNRDRSFDADNRDRSFDTDNRDRSFDADNRDRSFDTDNRDPSLNTDNRDRSFDTDNRDRFLDADNRDRSFDTDNRDRSFDTGNLNDTPDSSETADLFAVKEKRAIISDSEKSEDKNEFKDLSKSTDKGEKTDLSSVINQILEEIPKLIDTIRQSSVHESKKVLLFKTSSDFHRSLIDEERDRIEKIVRRLYNDSSMRIAVEIGNIAADNKSQLSITNGEIRDLPIFREIVENFAPEDIKIEKRREN